MSSSVTATPAHSVKSPEAGRSNKSVYLVLGCTIFAAAAQVLMKFGAGHPMPPLNPSDTATWVPFLLALLGNLPLLSGYCMSAITAFLLILGLRDGELSMLYPIIAMTYVWVNLLSMYFFQEHLNFWKTVGIALVIGGVAMLGRGEFARMTRTPLSSILLVLLASLIGSFGAVFLKFGAAHLKRGLRYIFNWQLATGVGLYLGSSVPFVMGLKNGELSVLYPMVSAGYICTMFWSRLFFKEPITRGKIGALALILAGIVCIGVGGK